MTEYISDWIKQYFDIYGLVKDEALSRKESMDNEDIRQITTSLFIELNQKWSGQRVHDNVELINDKPGFETPILPRNPPSPEPVNNHDIISVDEFEPVKDAGSAVARMAKGKGYLWAEFIFPYMRKHGYDTDKFKVWEMTEDEQNEVYKIVKDELTNIND